MSIETLQENLPQLVSDPMGFLLARETPINLRDLPDAITEWQTSGTNAPDQRTLEIIDEAFTGTDCELFACEARNAETD